MTIRIVSDTSTGLPADVLAQYQIRQTAQIVHFGEETLRSGVDITSAAFFARLSTATELPKTSAPTLGDFIDVYTQVLEETPNATILSIHPSAEVSGSVRSALVAAAEFPGADIRVIDTRFISTPLGLMVWQAGRMVADGAGATDVEAFIAHASQTAKVYFVVNTLEYLAKGGRIGRASHLMGAVLDIKPILTMEEGVISSHSRVRTRKKSLQVLREMALEGAGKLKRLHLGMGHAVCADEAQALWSGLVAELQPEATLFGEITPEVGVHTGPGLVAVAWVGVI